MQQKRSCLARQVVCRRHITDCVEKAESQLARRLRPFTSIGKKAPQSVIEIDIISAQALFRQHDRKHRRLFSRAFACGCNHHRCEPRRQGEASHQAALRRQCAAFIKGAKIFQECDRFFEGSLRWRVQKGERRGVMNTPMGKIERKAGKIARQNLRRRKCTECCRLPLMPEANGNAGLGSAGATGALIGRGA